MILVAIMMYTESNVLLTMASRMQLILATVRLEVSISGESLSHQEFCCFHTIRVVYDPFQVTLLKRYRTWIGKGLIGQTMSSRCRDPFDGIVVLLTCVIRGYV